MDEKNNESQIPETIEGKPKEEGNPTPQRKSALEEAKEVRDQLRLENDRREAIMKREEEMYARNLLSGKTDAGDLKLTPEQIKKREAEGLASEIVSAFKKR